MSDSTAPRINLRLASGPGYRLTTWLATFPKERVAYANNAETRSEKYNATVRRLLTPQISAILNLGYEDTRSTASTVQTTGPSWSVGLGWDPSPRTSVHATTGRRVLGGGHDTSNTNVSVKYRARMLTFSTTYTQDVTDTRSQLLGNGTANTIDYLDSLYQARYPDPVERQTVIQQFIAQNGLPPTLIVPVDFFSTQLFLSKQWLAGIGYEGRRNTVLANYFSRNSSTDLLRSGASTTPVAVVGVGDFSTSSTVKQTGAGVNWLWRITPFDSSNVSVGYTRSEFPATGLETNQTYLRASLTHQFSQKVTGFVNLRRLKSDSN